MQKRYSKYTKRLAALGSLALLASLFAFAAPVAQGQTSVTNYVSNFMPDEDFANGEKTVLADQFDGFDNQAHLTAVAEDDADRVSFYRCATGTTDPNDFRDPDDCTLLGTDTTGVQPTANADEAYEIFHDVTTQEETDGPWAVLALACTGAPNDTLSNCASDIDDPIVFDNSGSGGARATGEIDGLCFSTTAANCDQNVDYDDNGHGSDVAPNGFFVQFTTSDDVNNALACIDEDADGQTSPGNCDQVQDANLVATETDHKVWRTAGAFTAYEDDDGFDLLVMDDENGNNLADAAELVLDEHYKASLESEEEAIAVSFLDPGGTNTTIPDDADCEDPDTEATHTVDPPGDVEFEDLEGCLFDQFDNRLDGEVTFELTGTGEITACEGAPGVLHDHDDDGKTEHCHSDNPGGDNRFEITISNDVDGDGNDGETGRTTITFCSDDEAIGPSAGTEANPAAEHGCSNEDSVQAVKDWVPDPEESSLVFDDGDDDCAGPTNQNNNVGDEDVLIFCVTDEDGNGVPGQAVRWTIQQGADDQTNTQFVDQETETDENGRARATIRANSQGSDNIQACAPDSFPNFDPEQCQQVQKNVVQGGDGGGGEIPCDIAGTDEAETLTGTEGDDVICGFGGDDTLIGLGGDDVLLGGGGADHHDGGDGSDTIDGDQVNACLSTGCADGNDTAQGGGGKDSISGYGGNDRLQGGDKNDFISGGGGDDLLQGQNGWDTLRGNAGDDELVGARGRDVLQGGRGNDLARGGADEDTIRGFNGSDFLRGGRADDIIKGGGGPDTLRGGRGNDILDGGGGNDRCGGGRGNDVLRSC